MKRSYEQEVQASLYELNSGAEVGLIGYVGSGKPEKYPLFYVQIGRGSKRVLLSAGIHGNEPAGVYALLEFLKGPVHDYTENMAFTIFPCLNPWGFEHDRRFNVNGIDINRSFVRNNSRAAVILKRYISERSGFALALNLHEDKTEMRINGFPIETNPSGFYLYETPCDVHWFGTSLVKELENRGVEVCKDREIYGDENRGGVAIYNPSDPNQGELEAFLERHVKKIICTETPTCWPLERRVQTQKEAMDIALNLI